MDNINEKTYKNKRKWLKWKQIKLMKHALQGYNDVP